MRAAADRIARVLRLCDGASAEAADAETNEAEAAGTVGVAAGAVDAVTETAEPAGAVTGTAGAAGAPAG